LNEVLGNDLGGIVILLKIEELACMGGEEAYAHSGDVYLIMDNVSRIFQVTEWVVLTD